MTQLQPELFYFFLSPLTVIQKKKSRNNKQEGRDGGILGSLITRVVVCTFVAMLWLLFTLHPTHPIYCKPKRNHRTTTLCIAKKKKRKKKEVKQRKTVTEPAHACWPLCCLLLAHTANRIPDNKSQAPHRPPPPTTTTGHSTAIANLDGFPDRQRRRHSYLREQRRRRHPSVWETQHIRPLPQRLPSTERAIILMYYTAAVSKETRAGHMTP